MRSTFAPALVLTACSTVHDAPPTPDCEAAPTEWTAVVPEVENLVSDLALAPNGDIVVVGPSIGASGLAVLDSAGNARWARAIPMGRPNVAVAPDGRIVVGTDSHALLFSPDGDMLADRPLTSACTVAVGAGEGRWYAAELVGSTIRVTAFALDGGELWRADLEGTATSCTAGEGAPDLHLGVSPDGDAGVAMPGVVALVDRGGTVLWRAGLAVREVHAVVVGPDLDVFVGGSFHMSARFGELELDGSVQFDGYVAGYDRTGAAWFAKQIAADSFDYVYGLALDEDHNVYATGHFGEGGGDPAVLDIDGTIISGTNRSRDAFVVSWARDGALRFARSMTSDGEDAGRALAVDACGRIVLGGFFSREATFFDGTSETATGTGIYTPFLTRFVP